MTHDATRILMCPPDFFEVDYEINPWMDGHSGSLDRALAREQWTRLRDGLAECADVVLLEPRAGLPDLVFTANAGFVYGARAVPSHFMPHERRPEEPYLRAWFEERGYDVRVLPDNVAFEGAGDALIDRHGAWLWAGYGFRTELVAHDYLRNWFDLEVVSIRLVDPRFYHIDTCLCPLDGGFLLYHPPAFDSASRDEIERRVPAERRIPVSMESAGQFACNAVNVGRRIFMNRTGAPLVAALEERGFEVAQLGLSEFLKAGGSAKCLTLKLTEPRRAS
ncbi:MAG: dimethylarginine dimethylaminohydrolase family protein [Gammaproteobacteria bacterium]